jgi:hypothetical protein
MNPFAVKSYWKSYKELPENIQKLADAKFELWKENPFHPSLHSYTLSALTPKTTYGRFG